MFGKFATYGRLWDTASLTPWYSYPSHQGWVDDDQSLAIRYQFVNQRNLRGIMIWALGYDGARTEAWDALKTAFGKAPDPPPDAGTDAGVDAGTAEPPISIRLSVSMRSPLARRC